MAWKQGITCAGALLVGVAAGWVAGMLTAPAAGDETRRRLMGRLDEEKERLRREARKAVEQTAKRLEHGLESGKQKLEQALS
jgi:gas vesicle protein